jgi:hypothetical protein
MLLRQTPTPCTSQPLSGLAGITSQPFARRTGVEARSRKGPVRREGLEPPRLSDLGYNQAGQPIAQPTHVSTSHQNDPRPDAGPLSVRSPLVRTTLLSLVRPSGPGLVTRDLGSRDDYFAHWTRRVFPDVKDRSDDCLFTFRGRGHPLRDWPASTVARCPSPPSWRVHGHPVGSSGRRQASSSRGPRPRNVFALPWRATHSLPRITGRFGASCVGIRHGDRSPRSSAGSTLLAALRPVLLSTVRFAPSPPGDGRRWVGKVLVTESFSSRLSGSLFGVPDSHGHLTVSPVVLASGLPATTAIF